MSHEESTAQTTAHVVGGLGAGLLALVGGLARNADDLGRVLRHADDLAPAAIRQADDFSHVTAYSGDDMLRSLDDVSYGWSALDSESSGLGGVHSKPQIHSFSQDLETGWDSLGQEALQQALESAASFEDDDR